MGILGLLDTFVRGIQEVSLEITVNTQLLDFKLWVMNQTELVSIV